MKKFLILFASDMHGNVAQYKKIFKKAERYDALVLGGDLTPKDNKTRSPKGQRIFLKKIFIPLCRKLSSKSKCKIYIIMGNDDFKSNMKFLAQNSVKKNKRIFYLIENKQLKLNEDYFIGGYPYVPPTPFIYKDWERREKIRYKREFLNEGVISKDKKLIKHNLSNKTIIDELNKNFRKNLKQTILIIHAPPYGTKLDVIKNKKHVGSKDIRSFIEKKQPYLTLHGHIHETVKISEEFRQKIGKTLCASSGNDHKTDNPFVLILNLYERDKIKRINLS